MNYNIFVKKEEKVLKMLDTLIDVILLVSLISIIFGIIELFKVVTIFNFVTVPFYYAFILQITSKLKTFRKKFSIMF